MRKINRTIEAARNSVTELLGKEVLIRYNKGRNNFLSLTGRVEEVYSNVFLLSVNGQSYSSLSCTYVDVLCGDVSLKPLHV